MENMMKIIMTLLLAVFGANGQTVDSDVMAMADLIHETETYLYLEDYTEEQAEVIELFMDNGYGEYMTVTAVDDVHATITDSKGNEYKVPEREYLTNDVVFVIVDSEGSVRLAMWVSYLSPDENVPSKNIDGTYYDSISI